MTTSNDMRKNAYTLAEVNEVKTLAGHMHPVANLLSLKAVEHKQYLTAEQVICKIEKFGFKKLTVEIQQEACILAKWYRMGFLERKAVKNSKRNNFQDKRRKKVWAYIRNGKRLKTEERRKI